MKDKIMEYVLSKRNNHSDWKPNIGHSYDDNNTEKKLCSKCGRLMIRRPDKFREGKFWWGCKGYPNCNYTEKE